MINRVYKSRKIIQDTTVLAIVQYGEK